MKSAKPSQKSNSGGKQKYLLIGAGGTGSILFPPMVRYLESLKKNEDHDYLLVVFDGKEVKPSNLDRQLFNANFIANNKATALIEQYATDPEVVIAVPRYLGAADMDIIQEGDIVLIAADNWPIRGHVEGRAKNLDNITVINGGNELFNGSLQIWIRRNGKDITPPLSQNHPEILQPGEDMAELSCQEIAELPGGGQTIIANMMSAVAMLNAIRHAKQWTNDPKTWNEVQFDLNTFAMRGATR